MTGQQLSFLFITSNNLATNPRLVKELKLIHINGHRATVLLFELKGWSEQINQGLMDECKDVRFVLLPSGRKPFFRWLISSLLEKLSRLVPMGIMNAEMFSYATGKRSFLLLHALKKMGDSYDWVIAHNPAAFYPALKAAQKTGAALGIDVEDYHPGESNNKELSERVKRLMTIVLSKASYCSYAAPLIMHEVQKDIPNMSGRQVLILNGFEQKEFIEPAEQLSKPIQLVWFSQNIDINRGLENLIPAVNELYPSAELHLIGNLKSHFDQKFLNNKAGIILHKPKLQKELHSFLSNFDIGVATDIPVDRNRELALTNKIIAYAQAGLYILATKTEAQLNFLSNSELQFHFTGYTTEDLKESLLYLIDLKKRTGDSRASRFKAGKAYNWETNSQLLLQVWEK